MKKFLGISVCAASALALLLSGCGGSTGTSGETSSAPTTAESTAAASEAPATDASFVDGVLTTPEMKIVITDNKVIQPGDKGNEYGEKPVMAFWYEITNLSGGDISPMNWIFVFTAYQDNNPNAENELNVGTLPDDAFLDSQTETIKKGGTVANAVAYELDDTITPVELVASDGLGTTEIGRETYPVK